jgi:peptidyl-tRNA hydrolase
MSKDDEKDPIVLYLIVREALLDVMNAGKLGAQIGHGVEYVIRSYYRTREKDKEQAALTEEYFSNGSRKVVLKAADREFQRVKEEFGERCYVVVDAGLTLLEPGTETVVALLPQYKSAAHETIIRKLQVLK